MASQKNKKIEVPSDMSRGEIIFLTQVVMSIIGVLILAVIVAVILGDTVFQKHVLVDPLGGSRPVQWWSK